MTLHEEPTVWISLLVAAVAAYLMLSLGRRAKATAAAEAPTGAGAAGDEALLLRFVVDEAGERRGETVALDGDAFILKTADGFCRLGKDQIQDQGGTLRLVGPVDWESSKRDGDAWRVRSHKEITYTPEELPRDEP